MDDEPAGQSTSEGPVIESSDVSETTAASTDSRPVDPSAGPDEPSDEPGLRPETFDEFVGQGQVTENLEVMVEAARINDEVLDHVLLSGPPGLGKTTLAHILAGEMGVDIRISSGPALERPGDLASILTGLSEGDALFIDECHRLAQVVEEKLYPAMDEFQIDVVVGEGPAAETINIDLEQFTLIGATTRAGLMTAPFRSRFGAKWRLNLYDAGELKQIVERSAAILGVETTEAGAREIAERSRGTPRIANRLLRRVRDYATVREATEIDRELADYALEQLGVDGEGLDNVDRKYLETLCGKFGGGPSGKKTLASAMGEEPGTIELVIEPFLLQRGFIERTPQGRQATRRAFDHLDVAPPESGAAQTDLV